MTGCLNTFVCVRVVCVRRLLPAMHAGLGWARLGSCQQGTCSLHRARLLVLGPADEGRKHHFSRSRLSVTSCLSTCLAHTKETRLGSCCLPCMR